MKLFLTLLLLTSVTMARAEDWKLLFGLRGEWRFELGDDEQRSKKYFDDSQWETIYAPSAWEDEGFPGYDGYAWYRKHFRSTTEWRRKTIAIRLGNIDDVDEVYLNGHLIGSTGRFPPNYQTAYNADRIYYFSPTYLSDDGNNVIAVRVYDEELSGGILRGALGVYEDLNALQLDLQLAGQWKFSVGDDLVWGESDFNDSKWDSITVPAFWEKQGYPDYDGFGWYRLQFRIPQFLIDERLILVLGKIDDYDEVFLNGKRIGKTGSMATRSHDIPGSDAYTQFRAYYIPQGLLRSGGVNVVAVRVYDGFQDGGIYTGPIGIVQKDKFIKWQKKQKGPTNIFDWFFKQ